jgi:hypothetical protein
MQEASARANVLPGLKTTRIIDNDGKPLDRAKKWRDDQQYANVCNAIRQDCYPKELLDAIPDPAKDRSGALRWFANHTGAGTGAVEKMVRFYALLSEADPAKGVVDAKSTDKRKPRKVESVSRKKVRPGALKHEVTLEDPPNRQPKELGAGPAVHINLQVHISADASTDQIDQVFASMAKHIYKKGVE